MLSLEELQKMPAGLSRESDFRKNTSFKEGGDIPTCDSFYFWINGEYMLYSEQKEKAVVLGTVLLS